jgi:putative flippase GtrA
MMRDNFFLVFIRWFKFLIGGAINTAITYSIYLGCTYLMPYQIAYFFAFVIGIVFSFLFNSIVVFRVPLNWHRLIPYPFIYFFQYVFSAILLAVLVETVGLNESIAPLLVALLLAPFSYLLNKKALKSKCKVESSSS